MITTDDADRYVEALSRICDGPAYAGRGVPTDRPYAYTHRRSGAWVYARSTSGLFVAVRCEAASLPTSPKSIDRHLAVKRDPEAVTTAGRLRGWLDGLAAGGFSLARFGYTVFEIGQLALALGMPFIGDGDAANVHAPVEEFYRFDRMRRRGYVNGESWRIGYYPVEYTPQRPLPAPFDTIPDFLDHAAGIAA